MQLACYKKLQYILVMEVVVAFHHENIVVLLSGCGKLAFSTNFLKFV
jgi:hypothetical protein